MKQVININNTLLYLKESLDNYTGDNHCQRIYKKLNQKRYVSEADFINDLSETETAYLNTILKKEMKYARNVQDDIRESQLNEVYELLF